MVQHLTGGLKPIIATIHKDELGDPDGVRLSAGGLTLLVDLMDVKRGKLLGYEESAKYSKPTLQHSLITLAYIKEVNAKLVEAGGEPIDGTYYTSLTTDKDVQVFGYQDNLAYTFIVPTDSKAISCKYKVRQIRKI